MSQGVPDFWAKLEASAPRGEELTARLTNPDRSQRLFAALDAGGQRHFLIGLEPSESALEDRESRGVNVSTRELLLRGSGGGRFIDIHCTDRDGNDAFELIGQDLSQALAVSGRAPAVCVTSVLAKWRRFWSASRRQVLSRQEQLGLFAELWFLLVWLIPRAGIRAVEYWRGPYRAPQDFQWPRLAIEAKCTLSNRARVHRIHGVEQLLPPQDGRVFLYSLRVRQEPGATNTLPGLVAACRHRVAEDDAVAGMLEVGLQEYGYLDLNEGEYSDLTLHVVDQLLIQVDGAFPRITPVQLGGTVPPGIEYVEYDVNLAGCEPLILARGPDDPGFAALF